MKYLMIVAALLMSGCWRESKQETSARYSDIGQSHIDRAGEACKNGVVYYILPVGNSFVITPAFNKDSTVRTCN